MRHFFAVVTYTLNDLMAVLASSRQMQMGVLICYMKLRKKIGLHTFIIFFSLSRVVRGDRCAKRHLFTCT